MRLWVEISPLCSVHGNILVSLLVRLWVEIAYVSTKVIAAAVSLLVRLWVEITSGTRPFQKQKRQPPCEAVSWNFNQTITATGRIRSASLWGCELKCSRSRLHILHYSQPPCEAVSWNPFLGLNLTSAEVSLLVRLWVEMHMPLIHSSCNLVSLLVRLWVEMIPLLSHGRSGKSASLWGCELKLSWAVKKGLVETVSLLVRLWVEMVQEHTY